VYTGGRCGRVNKIDYRKPCVQEWAESAKFYWSGRGDSNGRLPGPEAVEVGGEMMPIFKYLQDNGLSQASGAFGSQLNQSAFKSCKIDYSSKRLNAPDRSLP